MPKKSKTSMSLPPSSESFPFEELSPEIRDLVVSMLPPADLKNLRETSSANRDFVDQTIMLPLNLENFFFKLTGKQRDKFIQTYQTLYGDQFQQKFQAMLDKNPMNLVNFIMGMDRQKAYEYIKNHPNAYAENVETNTATMEALLAYILTVDDFNKIKFEDIDKLHNWSEELSSVRLKDTIHLMWFVVKCLQDPELQLSREERLDLIFEEFATGKYQGKFCNFKNLDCKGITLRGLQLDNLNLSGVNFSDSRIIETNLTNSSLIGANLSHVDLSGSRLENCNLTGVNLTSSNGSTCRLVEVDLSCANLTGADLTNRDLSNCTWTEANLSSAILTHADLSGRDLSTCIFKEADLSRANFTGANLTNRDLSTCTLVEANFSSANLTGADLSNSDLTECQLLEANLSHANLADSNLYGIELATTNLYKTNLTNACILDFPYFIPGLSPTERLDRFEELLSILYEDLIDCPRADDILILVAEDIKYFILNSLDKLSEFDIDEAKKWLQIAENHELFNMSGSDYSKTNPHSFYSPATEAQVKPGKSEALKVFDDPELTEILNRTTTPSVPGR